MYYPAPLYKNASPSTPHPTKKNNLVIWKNKRERIIYLFKVRLPLYTQYIKRIGARIYIYFYVKIEQCGKAKQQRQFFACLSLSILYFFLSGNWSQFHIWVGGLFLILGQGGKRERFELVAIAVIELVLKFHPMKTQGMKKSTQRLHHEQYKGSCKGKNC